MTEQTKFQKTHEFKGERESLAFTPKDAGADTKARARANNTKTLLGNFQRQGDADLISMDLAWKQQVVIDEHNDRIAKLSRKWHAEDLATFSGLLQEGLQYMSKKKHRENIEKAQKDYIAIAKNPELKEKMITPYVNNVKLNDENVRTITSLGWAKNAQGESLDLVQRILNGGGYYQQTMRRLMKADIIEKMPEFVTQKLDEKVKLPDEIYPGLTEPIGIADISPDGEHRDPDGNIKPGGKYWQELSDRGMLGPVQQYLYAEAQKKVTNTLGNWYGMEAILTDFQPVLNAYFGDLSLKDAEAGRAFFNSDIQRKARAVTIKEINNLKPTDAVYELIKDVNTDQIYMGGHTNAYRTKLNQILVAFENGEITRSKLMAIEDALVNSEDHDNIGFTGTKTFRDWRGNDFDYVNWDQRIDAHILAAGKKAKADAERAVTGLQGEMAQYVQVNFAHPSVDLITKWATDVFNNGESGGLSIRQLVEKATENMATQESDTFENMKSKLEELVGNSGPIEPEVAANYPPEIVDWLKENKWLAESAWSITSSLKTDMDKSITALTKHVLEVSGDYDQNLSRDMLRVNGTAWITKEYKRLRAAGMTEHDAMHGKEGALANWHKLVKDDPSAWTVRRSTGDFVKKNTQSSLQEWNQNGLTFDKPLTALEDRLEFIAAHVRNGGRIHEDLTYRASDGNNYKVYDDTLRQLSSASGYTKGEILKQQLEGMGIVVGLDGEFKYLNADRRTQYIMERGGAGKIRAEVNASIKDSHLEKLEINQDGGKPYLGLPIASLTNPIRIDQNFEAITGINAEYLNTVEDGGFQGVLDKLGIKLHERLSPKHIALIQKRVLSEHGGIPFGVVDLDETGQSSLTYNSEESNLISGVSSSFKNDFNQRHFDTPMRITYATASDKGTPIGETKPANFGGGTLVFGIVSGSDTSVHLGWRHIDSQKKWIQELAKTQGKFYE